MLLKFAFGLFKMTVDREQVDKSECVDENTFSWLGVNLKALFPKEGCIYYFFKIISLLFSFSPFYYLLESYTQIAFTFCLDALWKVEVSCGPHLSTLVILKLNRCRGTFSLDSDCFSAVGISRIVILVGIARHHFISSRISIPVRATSKDF